MNNYNCFALNLIAPVIASVLYLAVLEFSPERFSSANRQKDLSRKYLKVTVDGCSSFIRIFIVAPYSYKRVLSKASGSKSFKDPA